MKLLQIALAAAPLAAALVFARTASAEPVPRISGPHTHENLSIFFVHGTAENGPVPLTLEEALGRGTVRVIETGEVNELRVENLGSEHIFIQSGDIVKGGKQDRVITSSLVLPPKSGQVPLAAFCVEQGRWRARGIESVAAFASSSEYMPSREVKLAMKTPHQKARREYEAPTAAAADPNVEASQVQTAGIGRSADRQSKVWDSVRSMQMKLSESVNAPVAAAESESSLQLSLENAKLNEARAGYAKALDLSGTAEGDIVGLVFAVNGRLNSADVYSSNGLFRKMWGKLLQAAVTEAIGAKDDGAAASSGPDVAAVAAFLKAAESGQKHEDDIARLMTIETRDAPSALFVEARVAKADWVHRNYLAK